MAMHLDISKKVVICKYCKFKTKILTHDILIKCSKCHEDIAFFDYGTIGEIFH